MTTTHKKPRRTRRSRLRSLLPETAQAVVWEGEKFVALPEREVDGWLEDLVDGIEATIALRESGSRLSGDEVKKRYGLA